MAAALLGMITFLPQVIHCLKTKDTKSLSLVTYIIILVNTVLWSTYGILRQDFAIVLVNDFIFVNEGIIVFMKLKYG